MKHIISFSGGMGSFAEAKLCVDEFGKKNVLLLFADTLTEDGDLYRFINETVSFLDCQFVRISRELNIWDLFEKNKFVANNRVDLCSRYLKREFMIKWIKDNFGYYVEVPIQRDETKPWLYKNNNIGTRQELLINAEVHLGIDFSEHHRLTETQNRMKPWIYRSLLVERGIIVRKNYSEQFGIKKPRLYDMGFGHNNCGGFCVKAGLGHFKILFEKIPERYAYHEGKEQELKIKCGTLPFLKKTELGITEYLTMREYRERYLECDNAENDKFDIGGCSCGF